MIMSTACGTSGGDNKDDYTKNNEAADVENEESLEYRPDGDYDTLTNAEKIAKDRRNHRKNTRTDSDSDDEGNASMEKNIQPSQDRNTDSDKQNSETEDEGNYLKQKQDQSN